MGSSSSTNTTSFTGAAGHEPRKDQECPTDWQLHICFNGAAAHEPRKDRAMQPLALQGFRATFASVTPKHWLARLLCPFGLFINLFLSMAYTSASAPGIPLHRRRTRDSLVKDHHRIHFNGQCRRCQPAGSLSLSPFWETPARGRSRPSWPPAAPLFPTAL